MAREPAEETDEAGEEDRPEEGRRELVRDLLIAGISVALAFGILLAYTQVYPPLVVVESPSMQHGDDLSYVGVIDTGDLVLVQAARARESVVTWVQGRATGHSTYGDYGDVIIFRKPTDPPGATPVIHRAILYVIPNANETYDIPDLLADPTLQWEGKGEGGVPVSTPYALEEVTIHGMGWQGNLGVTFDLKAFAQSPVNAGRAGYITMGDNNAYDSCSVSLDPCRPGRPYDQAWIVPQENILGRARGEIPWFGLLKLTFQPTFLRAVGAFIGAIVGLALLWKQRDVVLFLGALILAAVGYFAFGIFDPAVAPGGACCDGWGDSRAPQNSWDSLAVALPLLLALPFLIEAAVWGWSNFVSPRLRRSSASEETPSGSADDGSEPK